MDLTTILMFNTLFLLIVLVILVLFFVMIKPRSENQMQEPRQKDIDSIKQQVEAEGKQEAEEELMPYKPPRLNAPRRKRL